MKFLAPRMKGYTLIELMVVITIVLTLMGFSITSYLSFNENRSMDIDAKNFNSLVNKVRLKSVFLEYPSGCTKLTGYTIKSSLSTEGVRNSVTHFANCLEGEVGTLSEVILKNSTFLIDFNLVFFPISGNLDSIGDQVVTLRNDNSSLSNKVVTINHFLGTNNSINNEE